MSRNPNISFSFPQQLETLRRVYNIEQLRIKLNQLASLSAQVVQYKFKLRKNIYLYAHCQKCSSRLRYRWDQIENSFVLGSIQPFHDHKMKPINYEPISLFLKTLPFNITKSQAKAITMSHFNISSSKFYYVYNKIFEPKLGIKEYIKNLDQKGSSIHLDPFDPKEDVAPEIIVIVTPEMKEAYIQFGCSISLDFTFHLIKDKHPSGKSYKAGYIMGKSFSNRMVPFGIAVCLEESKQVYYGIIKSFGQIMGTLPNVIVTDQSLGAIHGIKQLIDEREFTGVQLLDVHHILKNVQKKLTNKDNLKLFSQLIKVQDENKFELLLDQAFGKLQDEQLKVLQKFVNNSSQYCLSQIQSYFCTSIPSTGINEKSHDLLKSIIPISKPITIVVNQMIKLAKRLLQKCKQYKIEKQQVEKYFGFNEIKSVRLQLDYKVFRVFCQQLSKSLKTQIISKNNTFQVLDFQDNSAYQFKQKLNQEGRPIFMCSCKYSEKVGLPCRHLLRVLLAKNLRILDYINKYWKVSSWLEIVYKKRVSSGTKTRRRK